MLQVFGCGCLTSLTSFIAIPVIRAFFKHEFPVQRIQFEGGIKAAPVTENYSLIGTAFDYLFRFFLQYENPHCIARKWVAENSLIILKNPAARQMLLDTSSVDVRDVADKMGSFLSSAKKIHAEYLENGNLGDDLIEVAVTLAQMDMPYRIGRLPPNFGHVDKGDIEDLRNLISLVKPKRFLAKKACYLNPTFGYGSELVGGADADLIVDDTLIDIKTTKKLSFKQDQYNQLIGYYVLSKLGTINGSENAAISKVGIYFSRYGILHTIPTREIENSTDFPKFVNMFEELARAANFPSSI